MGKMVSRNASFYVWDSSVTCRTMSGLTNNITITYSAEAPEVTGFGDANRTRLPDGIKDWELSFDAFYSTGANEVDEVLSGILGASTYFMFGPNGSTSGCMAYGACAVCTSYDITFAVEDAATVSATLVNRAGSLTRASACWAT